MSYDLRVLVKVEGCDRYAVVGEPKYSSPTYNLRDMFVACMDWDYEQGKEYPVGLVVEKLSKGINELSIYPSEYKKYVPKNGWGSIESALRSMKSWYECIGECCDDFPIECLYARW